MSEKRILHIVSGDLWAGKEAQLAMQLPALESAGEQVSVLLFNEGTTQERFLERGLDIQVLSESMGFFKLLAATKRYINDLRPEIVVAHGYKEALIGALCARSSNSKFVSTFHGAPEPGSSGEVFRIRIYGFLHKMVSRLFAARIVCPSRALAVELGFANDSRVRVVHNVTEFIDPKSKVDELANVEKAVVVVGRLAPVKNVETAIKSIAQIAAEDRPTLFIVGDGPEKGALETMVERLGLVEKVRFLGFRNDALELIYSADLVLLTSLREGIPTVLLEAASFAKPVVSSNLAGVQEAFAKLPGYPISFCAIGAAESFARAISERLSMPKLDPAEWRSLMVKHFSAEAAALTHSEIYQELR